MKKILITIGLMAVITTSSFAQGNFIFQSAAGAVWDDWSTSGARRSSTNRVAFLFGTGSSLVGESGFGQSHATNDLSAVSPLVIWNAILNDPNYKLATNNATSELITQQTSSVGGVSYLGGAVFQVAGTSAAGGIISMYVIGWSAQYLNPFEAALAGSPVGWSPEFNYSYAPGPNPGPSGTPGNMNGLFAFGVAPVPEPTTLALAGLGAASLLIFRKRKQ